MLHGGKADEQIQICDELPCTSQVASHFREAIEGGDIQTYDVS